MYMEPNSENLVLLSAIIPIAGFPNGLKQIKKWTTETNFKNFEIILVLDSESISVIDEVNSIATSLLDKTSVTLLNSSARNPGGTRNMGLSQAKGKWITFWDCDDIPNPEKFLEMVYQAQGKGADVALGAFSVRTGSNLRVYQNKYGDRQEILHSIAFNPGLWRFAFKTELAKIAKFPELNMAEDQLYLAKVLQSSKKISISSEIVYEYWIYPSGQLTKNRNALHTLSTALIHFEKIYRENKCRAILIVIIRLTITSIIYNNWAIKALSLVRLIKILVSDVRVIPFAIRSAAFIWKSK